MFNRELRMKVVKTAETEHADQSSDEGPQFEEKTKIIARSINGMILRISVGACAYAVFDTYRKILIARNTDL